MDEHDTNLPNTTGPALDEALTLGRTDCFATVGAGGKKSLLYALARATSPVVVTSTVHIPEFDDEVDALYVTDDPVTAVSETTDDVVGLVKERAPPDRYVGYPPDVVDDIGAANPGRTLVKADGARMRRFKAPNDDEPVVPSTTDVLAPVASIQVVGEPLTDALVHRPDRVAALVDGGVGDTITTDYLATVLTHPEGGLKDAPDDATVVPVLNMVDHDDHATVARDVADSILERSDRIERVVLTCLIDEVPVVDVVT